MGSGQGDVIYAWLRLTGGYLPVSEGQVRPDKSLPGEKGRRNST